MDQLLETVDVRETHISYVFLAGDFAYKLKKPVVLPFLDYGTPARRRQMCEAEVRLNRRLAPGIYLGVRSVVLVDGRTILSDPDDPRASDFVVEMRRFDERDTLAARLRAGTASAWDIDRVACAIAHFHRNARHVASSPRTGADEIRKCLAAIDAGGGGEQLRTTAALRRFADAFVHAHRHLLDRRALLGVEGHGDLRCDHVLLHDPVDIVDCVEFDARLRVRDPAADIAFLAMDLEAHGHPEQARMLVADYARYGGDPGPVWLQAFYAMERALVRASVHTIRAQQTGEPAHAAAAHLALARRLAWRARGPMVIVLCGLSGSGKSHLAGRLATELGARVHASDRVRKELAQVDPLERAGADAYTCAANRAVYAELGRRVRAELDHGEPVVVDATFRDAADRAAFAAALPPGHRPLFFRCTAPNRVLRERVTKRSAHPSVSDADQQVLASQRFAPLDEIPRSHRRSLNTNRRVADVVRDLETQLDERLRVSRPVPLRSVVPTDRQAVSRPDVARQVRP